MTRAQPISLMGGGEIAEYPIPRGERLESHYFVEFHYNRWMTSDTRLLADLDVRSVYLDLIFVSQSQDPVGTLPCDHRLLAKLAGVPREVFEGLCGREIGPLHKWEQVRCGEEIRLGHPVVTEIALKAVMSRKRNAAKNAEDRMRKRLATIRENLNKAIKGGQRIAQSDEMVNQISDWIEGVYPGGSATEKRIVEALSVVT